MSESEWTVRKTALFLRPGDHIVFTEDMGGEGEVLTVESIANMFGTVEIHTEELDFALMANDTQMITLSAPPEEEVEVGEMSRAEALDVVYDAAQNWANELSEYIIPASEAADDGAEYGEGKSKLDQALALLSAKPSYPLGQVVFCPNERGRMDVTRAQLDTIMTKLAESPESEAQVVAHSPSTVIELYVDPVAPATIHYRHHISEDGTYDSEQAIPEDDDYDWQPL